MVVTAPVNPEHRWTPASPIRKRWSATTTSRRQARRFGKGGWGIAYAGNIGPDFDRNEARARTVTADMHRYYPHLRDVPVTHDWCGPIDRTPNSLPLLGKLTDQIFYGVGWSGNGVGPSVLGGKILASLALKRDDDWSRYPLMGRSVGKFPRSRSVILKPTLSATPSPPKNVQRSSIGSRLVLLCNSQSSHRRVLKKRSDTGISDWFPRRVFSKVTPCITVSVGIFRGHAPTVASSRETAPRVERLIARPVPIVRIRRG